MHYEFEVTHDPTHDAIVIRLICPLTAEERLTHVVGVSMVLFQRATVNPTRYLVNHMRGLATREVQRLQPELWDRPDLGDCMARTAIIQSIVNEAVLAMRAPSMAILNLLGVAPGATSGEAGVDPVAIRVYESGLGTLPCDPELERAMTPSMRPGREDVVAEGATLGADVDLEPEHGSIDHPDNHDMALRRRRNAMPWDQFMAESAQLIEESR